MESRKVEKGAGMTRRGEDAGFRENSFPVPAVVLGLFWTILVAALFLWIAVEAKGRMAELARLQGQSFFRHLVLTRSWNAAHGGVYVPVTPANPPNPYLDDPLRDLVTREGLRLTKINPAYMTRQISEISQAEDGVRFHITGLSPMRPGNAPDAWERSALEAFRTGTPEVFARTGEGESGLFRYMAPLRAQPHCLSCHAKRGAREGEVLGGISVSMAEAPFKAGLEQTLWSQGRAYALIWAVGLVAVSGYGWQLHRRREQTEMARRRQSVRLANLSHDMRTPLSGIVGMAELMRLEGLLPDQEESAQYIKHAARSLTEVVDNILGSACDEAGRLVLEDYEFELSGLVESVFSSYSFEGRRKGLALSCRVAADLPKALRGDGFRLKQILANMVSNAVKFTDKGAVELIADRDPEPSPPGLVRLRVSVRDTGPGIPADQHETVFQRFAQSAADAGKRRLGTGLGLYIARELARLMDGDIHLESEPGRGSRFVLRVLLKEAFFNPPQARG